MTMSKREVQGLGLSYSFSGSEKSGDGPSRADEMDFTIDASISVQSDNGINEEMRQKLRRLEVALMEYRESLEDWGVKNLEEIERKVAVHRKRLQSEYGLSASNDDVSANKRSSLERKERNDDSTRESSRKRHRSQSPQHKSSSKDREKENWRGREKSGSRERDDHDRERSRDRDMDRRRRTK